MLNTQKIVRLVCGEFYVEGKQYPKPLPSEIEQWYGYCSDSGHNLICCLAQDYQEEQDLTQNLIPVPVKAVLKEYEIKDGYVVVDLPYSSELGLLTNPEDDEF